MEKEQPNKMLEQSKQKYERKMMLYIHTKHIEKTERDTSIKSVAL